MTNVATKIVLQEGDSASRRELRLQLSREPAAPPPAKPGER